MAVNNNVNQNSQEQIIQEQIRQQQVQQNQTVNNPTNNVEPVGANTEVSNPQPAVPSNETAQVQQMLADGNATRTTLNNQVDQIAIVLPPTDPAIGIPITPGTDIVDTLPANLPGLASTLKNENSIPYADQSFYEGLYDKARGLKDTYDSIPQAANAFYASLTPTEAVQNGQASQFFRYGSASSIGETIASHNNDLGYAKEVFEKIGSKGMAGILSDTSVSQIYDLKNNGNTSTPTKEFYGGLIDGLRKSGNFNAGDMYNLAKATLEINTAKRDELDANGNTQRGEYMNETREDANKVGLYGYDYHYSASLSKLDEFFNSESRPELKAMWEKGLGAAVDEITNSNKPIIIAGTTIPATDPPETKLDSLIATKIDSEKKIIARNSSTDIDKFVNDMTNGNWQKYGYNKTQYTILKDFIKDKNINKQGETIRKLADKDADITADLLAQAGRKRDKDITDALSPAFIAPGKAPGGYALVQGDIINRLAIASSNPSRYADENGRYASSRLSDVFNAFNAPNSTLGFHFANYAARNPELKSDPKKVYDLIDVAKNNKIMLDNINGKKDIYQTIFKSGSKADFNDKNLYKNYMEAVNNHYSGTDVTKQIQDMLITSEIDKKDNESVLKGAVSIPGFMKDAYQVADYYISSSSTNYDQLNDDGKKVLDSVLRLSGESSFDDNETKNAGIDFLIKHIDVANSLAYGNSQGAKGLISITKNAVLENPDGNKTTSGTDAIFNEIGRLWGEAGKDIAEVADSGKQSNLARTNGGKIGWLLGITASSANQVSTRHETAEKAVDYAIDKVGDLISDKSQSDVVGGLSKDVMKLVKGVFDKAFDKQSNISNKELAESFVKEYGFAANRMEQYVIKNFPESQRANTNLLLDQIRLKMDNFLSPKNS
jgi:hypothetical protein